VVVKNVHITNIHVRKYANVNHAVVVQQKDLYRHGNYRNHRIQRPDRNRIAHEYRPLSVIESKRAALSKGHQTVSDNKNGVGSVRQTSKGGESGPDLKVKSNPRTVETRKGMHQSSGLGTLLKPDKRREVFRNGNGEKPHESVNRERSNSRTSQRFAPVPQKKSDSDGNSKNARQGFQESAYTAPMPERAQTKSNERRSETWQPERRQNLAPNRIKKDSSK
jgi:hypothetical protein